MAGMVLKKLAAAGMLCGCLVLAGCAQDAVTVYDPLAGYDNAVDLPHITACPSECVQTAAPSPTPKATEYIYWDELPLDENLLEADARPTRRPSEHSLSAREPDVLVTERQKSELDNTGAWQSNVTGSDMACAYNAGEQEYMYYTSGIDGYIYREKIAENMAATFKAENAQLVSKDNARNFVISLQNDLLYVNGNAELIKLTGGDGSARETLLKADDIKCLTRWDDTIFFAGSVDDAKGIYSLAGGTDTPLMLIPDAHYMQIDAVNRRIIALDSTGIAAYSFAGEPIARMIDGQIIAFCHSGADLYYATGDAIYCLISTGEVKCVASAQIKWLGCHDNSLLYTDASDILHRADLDGKNDVALIELPVYNPTVIGNRVAYATTADGGISGAVKFE